MSALLSNLVAIVLLRRGPQDLPASQAVLGGLAAVYVLIGTLVIGPRVGDLMVALAQNVTDMAVLFLYTWGLLGMAGRPERVTQTLSAIVGANVLFSLIAWPLMLALPPMDAETAVAPGGVGMLLLAVLFWNLAVVGQIYRHALSLRVGLGVLAALGYFVLSTAVVSLLFPVAGA